MSDLYCGVDIGGTKILAGVLDVTGRVVDEVQIASPATDVQAIEDAIVEVVSALAERHAFRSVGVGAAGYLDAEGATVYFAPNLAWRDVPLKARLEARVPFTVRIDNDANAAAWGEYRFGAGVGSRDFLLLTVGTGIGGGIVHAGELFRGGFGIAAEVGHMRVVRHGHLCGCGNKGCWEQYASGNALVRDVRDAARAGSLLAQGLVDRAGGDVDAITGPMITEAAQGGDVFAIQALANVGMWLGEGIASLVAILDPNVIAIGGGVGAAGDLLIDPARRAFQTQLTGRGYRPEPEVRPTVLGNRAGWIGAADLGRIAVGG